MFKRTMPAIIRVHAILVCLVILAMPLLLSSPRPAEAQAICTQSATMELAYDDGVAWNRALPGGLSGCSKCTTFQGVRFTLPSGAPTAILTMTRVYAGGPSATLYVHVQDANGEFLTEGGIPFRVSGSQWYSIPLPNILVPNQFYIWVQRKQGGILQGSAEPYYDAKMDGDSHFWDDVSNPAGVWGDPPGDFMIRATIIPEVHVGTDYELKSLQEAIDHVDDGWTIVVHDGTYNENVTVDKSVIIKSVSGAEKTIVQPLPAHADSSVFRITASCVNLSGFTIKGLGSGGRAGIYIDDATGCVVSGNVIQYNGYGIYLSEGSENNILVENECTSNTNGIYVDGSGNHISGNNLHGNTALQGSAVSLSYSASANRLLFNTITVDPGTDTRVAAGPQVYNGNSAEQVSAVENWWGTDTGPSHTSNAGGQGPVVGEGIRFAPWLTRQPLRVETVFTTGGESTMDAREKMSAAVVKQGSGMPIVSAANFGENPFPSRKFPGRPMGRWTDVLFNSTVGSDQVEIRAYYTAEELAALDLKEGSLRFFWWNGEKWKKCSKTSVDKKSDFVWARLDLKTRPTSDDLGGTMFAVGVPKGGFAWWLILLILVIVIIALVLFRLFWVLVIRRERYTVD